MHSAIPACGSELLPDAGQIELSRVSCRWLQCFFYPAMMSGFQMGLWPMGKGAGSEISREA